ncbi:MAG: hypothetical protein R3324_13835 [Halobacteriales archaeon]|nr:hypothetical protein [Halobacteriales archaeon]
MDLPCLTKDQQQELLSAARTTVGDELRSVTFFTEDEVEQVYLREGLNRSADLVGFAENERMGFQSQMIYDGTQLGDYQFTIRVFDAGYLTRVIVGDCGVWVTTDSMPMDRFEELGSVLIHLLKAHTAPDAEIG